MSLLIPLLHLYKKAEKGEAGGKEHFGKEKEQEDGFTPSKPEKEKKRNKQSYTI